MKFKNSYVINTINLRILLIWEYAKKELRRGWQLSTYLLKHLIDSNNRPCS